MIFFTEHYGDVINYVRFEGVGKSNENIMFDHVGKGEVKQDITHIFFAKFSKL